MEFPLLALVCRAGTARFAVPAAAVTRVIGAAAFAPVPGLPGAAVGLVNVGGENLPLVDARGVFALGANELEPDQRFIEFHQPRRWLLWVDAVDRVLSVNREQCDALAVAAGAPARLALRLEHETVALLSPEALDPGAIVQPVQPLEASSEYTD